MYRVIGGDQKEYGPATAEELRQWIADGRLSSHSLIQEEGSGSWQPLSSFPEFADSLQAQAAQYPRAASIPPLTDGNWSTISFAAAPDVEIGRCLSRGGTLLAENFGLLFAAVFLVWMIGLVCQFLPFAGFVYWIIRGALLGGLYLVFLKRIRGQSAAVGDVFAAFSFAFVQLMLASLVTSLLSWIGLFVCLLPGIYLLVAWVFSIPLVADKGMEFWSAMELSRKVVTRVWFQMFVLMVLVFLPYLLITIYTQIKISASMLQAMQQAMGSGQPDFTRLMEMATQIAKQSLPLILISKFVLLVNMPFAFGAIMYAYEDIFGPRPTSKT